jgi:hypothetical protein
MRRMMTKNLKAMARTRVSIMGLGSSKQLQISRQGLSVAEESPVAEGSSLAEEMGYWAVLVRPAGATHFAAEIRFLIFDRE